MKLVLQAQPGHSVEGPQRLPEQQKSAAWSRARAIATQCAMPPAIGRDRLGELIKADETQMVTSEFAPFGSAQPAQGWWLQALLLLQDDNKGLQVEYDGSWVNVDDPRNAGR